jgi:hypothetical protein
LTSENKDLGHFFARPDQRLEASTGLKQRGPEIREKGVGIGSKKVKKKQSEVWEYGK